MEYAKEIKVRNNNDKVKIVLNDKYLIFKYISDDKKIKRSDIRSSLISGSYFSVLTYDNNIIKYPLPMNSSKFKEGLKLVINEINKENIIFYTNDEYEHYVPASILISQLYIGIFKGGCSFSSFVFFILLTVVVYFVIKHFSKPSVLYDVDKREISQLNNKKQVINKFDISDVVFVKNNNSETVYSTKSTSFHFKLEYSHKKITYPIKYVNEIENLNKSISKN